MSVRKRQWTTAKGELREGWVVNYTDAKGVRRLKTFPRKREADAFAAAATVEIRDGVHVADSVSVTVKSAGAMWIATAEAAGLERTTVAQYGQHKRLHIDPFIGSWKLSSLSIPSIREFEDTLRTEGVHIPRTDEIKAIVGALEGRWRPILLTAIFTGLRASELRGLRWSDLDLDRRELRVEQRADRFNDIGAPKSESGERTVPLPPLVANALKEWRLACPKGELGLAFPNAAGGVESHHAIRSRGLIPAQIRAGITIDTGEVDKEGAPIPAAKYTGLHALRHFYASWCINRLADGGLGLPLKLVQERMGHASVVMTSDVYGHLFPTGDDGEEMAAAERALLA